MTLTEFNEHCAATADSWFEPETLDRLNDLAFSRLAKESIDDDDLYQIRSWAFDWANNAL